MNAETLATRTMSFYGISHRTNLDDSGLERAVRTFAIAAGVTVNNGLVDDAISEIKRQRILECLEATCSQK